MGRLRGAGFFPDARRPSPLRQILHLGPCCLNPCPFHGRNGQCLGEPFGVLRAFAQQPQRACVIGHCAGGGGAQITIGLVHQDQIGDFHDPALDPLQFIPARGRQKQHEKIAHLGHHRFGLAHAHCLDQDNIKPCRLTKRHRRAGAARHAAEACLTG